MEDKAFEAGRIAFREGKRKVAPKKLTRELAKIWCEGWEFERGQGPQQFEFVTCRQRKTEVD